MQAQKSFIPAIFHAALKKHPKGSLVPDQVIKFFLEQSCTYCLRGKYLVSDPIAIWLMSECDFTDREVADFLTNLKPKAMEETGVEILLPGSPVPQEPAPPQRKEEEVELESVEDAEDWGTEWDGTPIEEEQVDEESEAEKNTAEEGSANISNIAEPTSKTAADTVKEKEGLLPISIEKAASILERIALADGEIEPIYKQIVQDSGILGELEKSLFTPAGQDFKELDCLKKALTHIFILEFDYAYYAGKRKVENITLKEAIKQSKTLLERTKKVKEILNKSAQSASQEGRYGEAGALNTILEKLVKSESKLDELVSTLSNVPVKQEENVTYKADSAPKAVERTRLPKRSKSAAAKAETQSGKEKIKIALAFLFMAAVILGVALFLNNLFSKKTTLIVYNPADFSSIISLTEARRQGTAFIGVVNANYWNNLSSEDKEAKAEKLLETVKNSEIHGILLMTSDGKLVTQSYGDEIKIYK